MKNIFLTACQKHCLEFDNLHIDYLYKMAYQSGILPYFDKSLFVQYKSL